MRRLVIVTSLVSAFLGVAAAGAAASSIGLIGPWGPSVLTAPNTDSITLTYSVSAQQQVPTEALDAARQAASDWAAWVSSHDGSGTFTIEQAVGGTPTVPITIKNGGGVIAGKTKLTLDKQGLIKAASVQISGSNQGLENDPDTVYEITLHELGHAFIGLNHSDNPTDLMYPILNGSMSIGTCEENGFNELYAWLMDGDGSTGPVAPAVSSVGC